MSIEYTIDIQLTELGFPDILQSQQTQIRDGKEAAKQSAEVSVGSALPDKAPCKPAQTVDGDALSETALNSPTPGPEATDVSNLITEQWEDGPGAGGGVVQEESAETLQDEEDDSDDSEVSGVYEEEEVDDEDDEEKEEEEGPSDGTSGKNKLMSLLKQLYIHVGLLV